MAASAAMDHQMRLDVLANNLANVNTAGFKADDVAFQVTHATEMTPGEAPDEAADGSATERFPDPNDLPSAIKLTGYTDFSAGPSRRTGNPLDIALQGNGFFCIGTPGGIQYTRQGNFTLDQEGSLVTSDGHPVLGEGGSITIEGGQVDIDDQGVVTVDGNEIDRLRIVTFSSPNGLTKVGSSLFSTAGSGQAPQSAANVSVKQGYLENANVNAIRTMTDMIAEMRMVEAYQKIVQTADRTSSNAVNTLGTIV
jgi:flagellar basal-body rod protein FlgG